MDRKLRFLIIDNDKFSRMKVRRSLQAIGLEMDLQEVCDREHTMSLIQTYQFDFAFLDNTAPNSEGLALLETLRRQGFKQPIVVLTGPEEQENTADFMEAGASDCISKAAVDPQCLRQTIYRGLRIYRAERQAEAAQVQVGIMGERLKQMHRNLQVQAKQIEQQNQQLIEATRLKSEFITTVSHELRTPLNAIMGLSQMLERQTHESLNLRQQEMLHRIIHNGQHLKILINDLLDFSKIGMGSIALQPVVFDLYQLLLETIGEFQAMATAKQLEIQLDFQLKDPHITHDPVRIYQILIHLVSNAIKFTDRGRIQIRVTADGEATSPHAFIALDITDSGIGIAPKDQESIFDPFRQLDQSMTRRQAGTGLGLAMVRSLVELMGGKIELTSAVAQGSTFQVILPRNLPLNICPGEDARTEMGRII